MALNPNFASHSSRKLPLAFGYVLGSGDQVLNTIAPDNDRYSINILGEGEWDGYEMLAIANYAAAHLNNGYNTLETTGDYADFIGQVSGSIHFHGGQWSIKDAGNATTSTGPDQGYDEWFPQFPTVTPPQCFSGMAYAAFYLPGTVTLPFGTHIVGTQTASISGIGIWRGTRCRTFDASGNFVSYGFTCNPAWLIVEAILRYKIKPQQPPIAGLTDAEKACFNWPSIYAYASRNDFVLPNGNPRFFFSGIFASDATLTNILETLLRCSRAYLRVTNGQIFLFGDDARDPVFTLSAKHVVTGSLKLSKKNVSKAPNQFVPRYRDIDIPAVSEVATATVTNGQIVFALDSLSPFLAFDLVTYGGCSDATLDGTYQVFEPTPVSGQPPAYVPDSCYVRSNQTPVSTPPTGGYIGTNDARFSERAPTGVQHRSHQKMIAQQAPGLSVQPKVVPVYYDMGNSTFDQTNRIMKFERDSSLGPDTGAGWTAPVSGTVTAYFEAVDAAGLYLKDVNEHDVITIDDWLSPEFAGQYVVKSKTITAPSDGALATVDLELMTYYPTAYTDVSDPPGDAYQIVPGTTFQLTGFTPVVNPAWTLIATPTGVKDSSGNWTISFANLVMQLGGVVGTTTYPPFSIDGIPDETVVVIYLDDPLGTGAFSEAFFQVGDTLTSQPAGRYIVMIGSFTNVIPITTTPGDGSVLFQPA